MAVLIEHFAGAFPLWMAPRQVVVLPISEKHHAYALSVVERLQQAGVRVEADLRNEKVGYKIREAQLQKVPYMLVVGDKEMAERQVSVRGAARRSGFTEPEAFVAVQEEIAAKVR